MQGTIHPLPTHASVAACQRFGVDMGEFLPAIQQRFIEHGAIFLAGSLVEGFGNKTSDLDVMIVSELALDGIDHVVRKDHMLINMIFGKARRIDLEYIHTGTISSPVAEIAALDIPVDFVAERIDERQELLIHRLLNAVPLFDTPAYRALLAAAQACDFRRYMVKRCMHKIDGAALDLEGMVDRGDPAEVLLRLFDIIDHSVDAIRFAHGFTNPLGKWRIRSLRSMPPSPEAENALGIYLRYRVFGLGLDAPDMDEVLTLVRQVLYWSDCALRRVYA
jgi:predicted nucleotidyltransferase|tara:strand:- start:8567 stop:9397 length:831 start_codon:yes stop_codon:yes gene_type:complete